MKFQLVDRVIELQRGSRIVAVKAVSCAEEYLADHFPTFPILPGVFMLQAMVESAAWLVRDALDFAPPLVLLREAKNVTYKSFVKPGQLLRVEVQCRKLTDTESDFEGSGYCGESEAMRGRFGLTHFSPAQRRGWSATVDRQLVDNARAAWAILRPH